MVPISSGRATEGLRACKRGTDLRIGGMGEKRHSLSRLPPWPAVMTKRDPRDALLVAPGPGLFLFSSILETSGLFFWLF
jgi:hypothetical protein